jgi:hypothetical protein
LGNKKADGKLHDFKENTSIQEEEAFTRPLLI